MFDASSGRVLNIILVLLRNFGDKCDGKSVSEVQTKLGEKFDALAKFKQVKEGENYKQRESVLNFLEQSRHTRTV